MDNCEAPMQTKIPLHYAQLYHAPPQLTHQVDHLREGWEGAPSGGWRDKVQKGHKQTTHENP